jgi:nucleotide-binding universal stress UspA family protein
VANAAKKWIVGLDLNEHSGGALRFAAWLADQGGDRLVALHVLEEDHLLAALHYHHLDEVQSLARKAADAAIDEAGARGSIASLEVLEGAHAEETLVAARTYHHCDGIIIGRNAPREGVRPVRLGRVARRVLRALPSPVFVVPPDLRTIGAGPVLVGCDLENDGGSKVEFARDFADRFGRALELVHVSPVPDAYGAQYWPEQTIAKIHADHTRDSEKRLAEWAAANGLAGATRTVRLGSVGDALVELARARDAIAIVTGSRRLSRLERWLLTSTGSDLAGHATCPVAIVPP